MAGETDTDGDPRLRAEHDGLAGNAGRIVLRHVCVWGGSGGGRARGNQGCEEGDCRQMLLDTYTYAQMCTTNARKHAHTYVRRMSLDTFPRMFKCVLQILVCSNVYYKYLHARTHRHRHKTQIDSGRERERKGDSESE